LLLLRLNNKESFMSAKERAVALYAQHIALASTDGRLFRKTVMDTLMAETGCSLAAAATHYNHAKKASPVEGLGRAPVPAGVRKAKSKPGKPEELKPDSECFAVIELLQENGDTVVGRCQTFLLQGDASETFDAKIVNWPKSEWVMIQGLGPSHGDTFKLESDEKEIKRYDPVAIAAAKAKAEADAAVAA
jgi:hypothetical protein